MFCLVALFRGFMIAWTDGLDCDCVSEGVKRLAGEGGEGKYMNDKEIEE